MAGRRPSFMQVFAPVFVALVLLPAPLGAEDAAPDLKALGERLARPTDPPSGLWLALWEVRELGSEAAPLVPAVAAHLGADHELTRRLAAETLGRIGAGSATAEVALFEALPRASGAFEEALLEALELLGAGVPFRGELPETITYASTPCLQELERAYARKVVSVRDLPRLEACRKEAIAHAERLATDPTFRLGEQTAASVASRLDREQGVRFALHWSAPFLLVGLAKSDDWLVRPAAPHPPMEAGLRSAADVCQAVYRHVLAAQGAALGLRPLEDAYGGRPDLAPGKRSFADGFPVQVWLVDRALLAGRAPDVLPDFLPSTVQGWFDPIHERGVLVVPTWDASRSASDSDLLGHVAAKTLLEGFGRQHRDWRESRTWASSAWLSRSIASLWGAATRDLSGRVYVVPEPPVLATWMLQVDNVSNPDGKRSRLAPLWMPLERLLGLSRPSDASDWAAEVGLNPAFGDLFARAQGTGLGLFLRDHALPERHVAWQELQRLALRGLVDVPTARKALGLRDVDEVEAFDAEFRAWWEARLATRVAPPLPATPAAPGAPR